MTSHATDTTEMFAVHDAFRAEFGALPAQITAVPDGDVERAGVVGGHVMMMTSMLHAHHGSEDLLLWPVLEERVPERIALVKEMESQHEAMGALIESAQAQAGQWMATASAGTASELSTTMAELTEIMVEHLAAEESQVMPIVSETFSEEEFARIGEHSRADIPPEVLPIGLGIILSDTTPERGAAILAFMPDEARAGFEQFGRPMYEEYRSRLVAAS